MPSPALGSQPPEEVPAGRRRTELSMLVFAFGVVAFAFANTALSLKGQQVASIVEYMIAFMAIIIGAHLAIRRWAPYADPLMLPLAAMLNGLGIVMTYRLVQAGRHGNLGCSLCPSGTLSVPMASSATIIQIVYTAIGVGLFVAVLVFIPEPRVLQRYTYILGLVGIVLIALPAFLPSSISEVANTGAKIQIRLGSFTVQPEEFAKLALAASFAGYLVAKRDVLSLAGKRVLGIDLPRGRDLGPIALAWLASLLLLVFESDIGTSAVFMGLFVAMIYIATSRTSWLLLGFVMFVVGAFAAAQVFSHVRLRFDIWLHPFNGSNPGNHAYQLIQGLYGHGQRRPARPGTRQRPALLDAPDTKRPGVHLLRRGDRADRDHGAAAALRAAGAARTAHRAHGERPVLQAARGRAVVHVRAAGLRDCRRRDPADPAHRDHHAVPLPGWLEPGGELGADRDAGAAE